MIPFTVLSNAALVIFLVWRKRYLRKQKSCVLLACLAATDLLVGAVVLPLAITSHAVRLSRAPVCLLDAVILAGMNVTCGASLYHLLIISCERYVAIKHALRYETLATTRRLKTAVATAWAIPVALTILSAFIKILLANHTALAETIVIAITILEILGILATISLCQVTVFLES